MNDKVNIRATEAKGLEAPLPPKPKEENVFARLKQEDITKNLRARNSSFLKNFVLL